MLRLSKTNRAIIPSSFLLFSFFITVAYADNPCTTQVLSEKLDLYAALPKMTLNYTLLRQVTLKEIKAELLNSNRTQVVVDYKTQVHFRNPPQGNLFLNDMLMVKDANGQAYQLRKGTQVNFQILATQNRQYEMIIPKGTRLKVNPSDPSEVILTKGTKLKIIAPQNRSVKLTLDPQTVVDRIPGSSQNGVTLTMEPERAPAGGRIALILSKQGFDFGNAGFSVCLRQKNAREFSLPPFIASEAVALTKVEFGKAELSVRIPAVYPDDVHLSRPVELLVVARSPDGDMAEAVSQEFTISSQKLAVICWIAALLFPWILAGIAVKRIEPQRRFPFNPIWFISGKYGSASLSLAQILIWTLLVFSASFYVLAVSGRLLDLTNEILILLGIAGGSSVIAKVTAISKDEGGRDIVMYQLRDPKWLDLFRTEGGPDLYKVQMALFTALAAVFVTGKIYYTLEFPVLPAGLLTLIGISNGVYLSAKATSKTRFEKLAQKERQLLAAKDLLEKLKTKTRAAQILKEKIEKEVDLTTTGSDPTAAKKTEARYQKASNTKTEADGALEIARGQVRELQNEFDALKKRIESEE
jgi:hypothetical protein